MKFILPLSIFFFSCTGAISHDTGAGKTNEAPPVLLSSYPEALKKTDSLRNACKKMAIENAGIAFSRFIDEYLIPHWIGTPWDFNGVTQTPNEGKIACGYLVTTVLRDAGVNINRVKQAQCASESMINSLTSKKENYSRLSFNDFISAVTSKGVGLSIIGLDNHTGFLFYDGKDLYFIHSSYVGEGKVARELAKENSILQNSNYKVVGYISRDEHFLRQWMK